jgi:hypothetical protein
MATARMSFLAQCSSNSLKRSGGRPWLELNPAQPV